MSINLDAYLSMLAWSEGTARVAGSDNGYNVLVGGTLFDSYADHPRKHIYCPRLKVWSTAAGRYQILERTYDAYKKRLGLTGFTPIEQDMIAKQMLDECGALSAIEFGNFEDAVKKSAHLWASLPGAGYQQHENKIEPLVKVYTDAGGLLDSDNLAGIA